MQETEMKNDCRAAAVIPALNEEEAIGGMLSGLIASIDHAKKNKEVEIYVSDNGSTDGTCEIVESFQSASVPVHLVREARKGVGFGRQAGVRSALARSIKRATPKYEDFWLICSDSDCRFPPEWIEEWFVEFDRKQSLLLGGKGDYPLEFFEKHPNVKRFFDEVFRSIRLAEEVFGVINLEGNTSAYERKAYSVVGPFDQPTRPTKGGRHVNTAGEDWDMGTRARLLGIHPCRTQTKPIVLSERRFEESPMEYVVGDAYEVMEFDRVEGSELQEDFAANEVEKLVGMRLSYLSMHFISKPLLVDSTLTTFPRAVDFLGEPLVKEIDDWKRTHATPDMFADRDAYIFGYLGSFDKEFRNKISQRWIENRC